MGKNKCITTMGDWRGGYIPCSYGRRYFGQNQGKAKIDR